MRSRLSTFIRVRGDIESEAQRSKLVERDGFAELTLIVQETLPESSDRNRSALRRMEYQDIRCH